MSDHIAMPEPARTIALIGATSGLGRAAAGQLSKRGHRLVLVGRDPKRIEQLARQLPTAVVIGADISTIAGIGQAAAMHAMSTSARKGAEPVASLATRPLRGPFGR